MPRIGDWTMMAAAPYPFPFARQRARATALVLASAAVACSGDSEPTAAEPGDEGGTTQARPGPAPEETATPDAGSSTSPPPLPPPADDPGPPPSGCSGITKDANGFFVRNTGTVSYVGFVPKSYNGAPTRLLVALHGCGDSAKNFAEWGAAPYATRSTLDHLAVSLDGASGRGNCWNMAADAPKVLAAVEDMASCFYVHRKKVVVGGFSSGGMLAYKVGLENAGRFAGVLVECANVPGNVDAAIAGASRKLPIAHVAHLSDQSFPIAQVRATWKKLETAGFPLQKGEMPGGHDGTTEDWAEWLIPRMATWTSP